MFLGHYEHTIDEKGRMTIPARFRELLENGGYVTLGFDQNLIVLPSDTFDALSERANQTNLTDPAARLLKRQFFANANRLEFDRAGRILIPQYLRQNAQLTSAAVVAGVGDSFEIWSPELWQKQNELLEETEANAQRFASLTL